MRPRPLPQALVAIGLASLAAPALAQSFGTTPDFGMAPEYAQNVPAPEQNAQNAPVPGQNAPGAARAPPERRLRIIPLIGIEETYSDNMGLEAKDAARHGWITDLAPGLRIEGRTSRLNLFVDFRFHDLHYAGASDLDHTQRFLDSAATFEAVRNWLYIDGMATRTQESRNPFGAALAPDAPSASSNRVETSVYQVSPFVRGSLGERAAYEVRLRGSDIQTDDGTLPHSRVAESLVRLGSPSPATRLTWKADAYALSFDNDVVDRLDSARIRLSLLYEILPELRVSLSEGRERTDFAGPEPVEKTNPGVGLSWTPSNRTQLAGLYERRFFGDGYNFLFTHRTRLTAWSVRSSRDAVVVPHLLAGPSSAPYGLFYDLLAASVPDPAERASAARRQLDAFGIPSQSILDSGFLSERPYLYQETEASVALLGTRNVVTFTYGRRNEKPFDVTFGGATPLLETEVTRTGYNANWAHRLTRLSTLTLSGTRLKTEGEGANAAQSREWNVRLAFSTRLNPQTDLVLGVRRSAFDSTTSIDYRENAIFLTLIYRPRL
ncbi:MAG TPA: TIGR03016 family PEP-CTERM system-associated outer membrane protein [Usitatibacter sp.]|nr:TIGR03016 family PEP-CTERM system-associated outer membrane protein [Usitatibacter sp.]